MAIYQNNRALTEQEIDSLLSAWPTSDSDGETVATHADLVAEIDFDARPNEVKAAIAASPKLVAAGISAAPDAKAPRWCVVTLPADTQTNGVWGTLYENLAKSFAESHTANYVEQVTNNFSGTIEELEAGGGEIESKSGVWRLRDRYDRWLGTNGYLSQIEAKL